ncbi:hypothetical protein VF13_36450 [Nostoc linckia z16]|nr:hypothetical protein VF13_36450 [Nostoc linckia z16]
MPVEGPIRRSIELLHPRRRQKRRAARNGPGQIDRQGCGRRPKENGLNDEPNQQQKCHQQRKGRHERRIANRIEQQQFVGRVRVGRQRTRLAEDIVRVRVSDNLPIRQPVSMTEHY